MYNTEDRYSEIKLSTVNEIINEWKNYKDFIVHLSRVNNTEDSKNLLSRNVGSIVELSN